MITLQGRGPRGAAAGPQAPPFMGGDAQNFFAQWAAAVAAANNNNNINNNNNNNDQPPPPSAPARPQPSPGPSQSGAAGGGGGGGGATAPSNGPNSAPNAGNRFFFPRPPPFPQVRNR